MRNVSDEFLGSVTRRANEILAAPGLATGDRTLQSGDILARFRVKRFVLELLDLCVKSRMGQDIPEQTLQETLDNLRRSAWKRNVASAEVISLVEDSCAIAEATLLDVRKVA